jgi:hypothetical protein
MLSAFFYVLMRTAAFAVLPVLFHATTTVARFYGSQLGICNSLVHIHECSGNKKYKQDDIIGNLFHVIDWIKSNTFYSQKVTMKVHFSKQPV